MIELALGQEFSVLYLAPVEMKVVPITHLIMKKKNVS